MAFNLNSKITIGKFSFKGVHSVRIRKSIFGIVDTATIKIPSKARVKSKSNPHDIEIVYTSTQFAPGDPVEIYLGYNGKLRLEFKGFVSRVNSSIPLEIECEGFSYQLKQKKINKFWASTTLKDVLQEITKGTDIKLCIDTDMPIVNLMVRNGNAARLIEDLREKVSSGLLTAYFIEPDLLYVGLLYTPIRNDVKYKIGYNVISYDSKVKPGIDTDVHIVFRHPTGTRTRAKTKNIGSQTKKIMTTHIPDAQTLKLLAEYATKKYNNDVQAGQIKTFLQPYAQPGDKIIITSSQPNGIVGEYICQSIDVTFGHQGARRFIDFGAKVGWDSATVSATVSETTTNKP